MSNKLIYLVEDNQDQLELLGMILKIQGFTNVKSFLVSSEVYSSIEIDTPDLVISDIDMPDVTGNDLARLIKNSDKYKKVKVLLLSGAYNGSEQGDMFMSKPYQIGELVKTINHLLSN